jgi:hypothetical protein
VGGTRDIKRMFGTWAGNYRNNLPEHLEAKLKKMLTDQGRTREARDTKRVRTLEGRACRRLSGVRRQARAKRLFSAGIY